jgi:predicted methyltransferase
MRTLLSATLFAWLIANAPASSADAIDTAVNDPGRTAADHERDQRDHPADLLRWFGLEPGMVVVDLFAGGGYFSEIVGHVVGDPGRVYMHNNAAYISFRGDALKERVASGRLQNVVRLDAEIGKLGIPDASVDLVLMVMTYHDLYFKDDDWSVDPATLFAEVNAMLKPGGILAIVDHVAAAGTGSSAAQELHRIDQAFAVKDIESRGFTLTGTLDLLRVPADDHSKSVFDPAIRGKTDRFVLRFVKASDRPATTP